MLRIVGVRRAMSKSAAAVAAVLLSAGMGAAELAPQAASQHDRQSYTSATTAILVDVVVRDKRGRPVADLSETDFEVAEDGVPQKIDTFTRMSHGGGIGVGVAWRSPGNTVEVTPTTPHPASASTVTDEATTALVFDHLSSDSLRLAQKA